VHSRLAIDYGAATVRAVLVVPGGTTILRLDDAGQMSTAVHLSSAGLVTGAEAWQRAAGDPDGMVISPLRAGIGQIMVGGVEVEVGELVAATLRQVAAEAQQIAGEPIDDVRLVVPAGWGPRRRTWLWHAPRVAGLPQPRLVHAPLAALAGFVDRASLAREVLALVVDVGAGGEVSVVHWGPGGTGEVISTLADPDAGGDRIDAHLSRRLTGAGIDELAGADRWTMLANVRAGRHALSEQLAVTVPMPGGQPPMVVGAGLVADAARPVFEHVGEMAAQALSNADLTTDQVGGVYLIGAAAATPAAANT